MPDAQQPAGEAPEPRHELTPQERERRERALTQITQLGDPVLRTDAVAISEFGGELLSLGAHMVALMDDAFGVGLAAPQVGRPIRLFVYREEGDGEARAVVNPVVEPITDETDVLDEGCLSIPGIHVPVERPVAVRLRGHQLDGTELDTEIHGFTARIVQHEHDHLNGVLILDRTTPEARRAALKELHATRAEQAPDSVT
ncbi:MAG: peptide deformylase [Patulibacter sp.]